jgi:hypothetical protein
MVGRGQEVGQQLGAAGPERGVGQLLDRAWEGSRQQLDRGGCPVPLLLLIELVAQHRLDQAMHRQAAVSHFQQGITASRPDGLGKLVEVGGRTGQRLGQHLGALLQQVRWDGVGSQERAQQQQVGGHRGSVLHRLE